MLERYGGLVYSLARRFLRNAADAEDAVQEIFVEIWKNADRFDPKIASEQTFVAMIARRRLIDRQRSAGRRPTVSALTDASATLPGTVDSIRTIENADEAALALRAVESLEKHQQTVLKMAVCEGRSHQEVADQLNMPLGTVKTHVRRGLIAVRQKIAAMSDMGVSS